ncbi:hypothetical protein DL93DRAFT_2079083 [Clavulina sp. PMI_390]|nr:hypothetical protein DL93DRAFT_2079083 [Clavulina sp. PMI_390]
MLFEGRNDSNIVPRTLDPLLGVFTGVLAFTLHERHPRTAPALGERLIDLVNWKRTQSAKPQTSS